MKRIIQWTVSLVCIVSLMVACSKEPKHYAAEASYLAEEMVASSAQAVHKSVMQADVAESLVSNKRLNNAETLSDSSGAVASLVRQARKLIKNASLHMEVDDAMGTSKAITQTANAGGGYIADTSRQKIGNNRFSISMTVRMPVENLIKALKIFSN